MEGVEDEEATLSAHIWNPFVLLLEFWAALMATLFDRSAREGDTKERRRSFLALRTYSTNTLSPAANAPSIGDTVFSRVDHKRLKVGVTGVVLSLKPMRAAEEMCVRVDWGLGIGELNMRASQVEVASHAEESDEGEPNLLVSVEPRGPASEPATDSAATVGA